MGRVLLCSAAMLGLLAARAASADIEMTFENTHGGASETGTTSMSTDSVRVETGKNIVIFQGSQNKMLVLDKDKHTYFDASVFVNGGGMQAMMAQRLAGLPEAQRKQVEAAMAQHGGMGGAGAAAPPEAPPSYEKGGSQTVGAFTCTLYHKTRNGTHYADSCIAPISALGLTDADLAAFKALGERMRSMAGPHRTSTPGMELESQTQAIGFPGFPVQETMYRDGQVSGVYTLKSIQHATLSADIFQIPPGYTQGQMGGSGGGQ